jgi:hypothetical protein
MRTMRWRYLMARSLAALAVGIGLGTASALVTVVSEPTVSAVADTYATLTFPLTGEGAYRYEVVPPEGWLAVTRGGELVLAGNGFVSVTVRVPTLAPAGERFLTEVRLFEGERVAATATGAVLVTRRTQVGLQGPDTLVGSVGVPLPFEVVVANDGNVRDTIVLSARHTHWDVTFDSVEIALDPGERRVVGVTLRPTTTVNTGYRHIFQIAAGSAHDPEVGTVLDITSRFFTGGREIVADRHQRPQLTLSLSARASAGVEIDAGAVTTSADYSVRPGLAGQLSDFVDGSAQTNPLAGSLTDPFEEVPSTLTLSLAGQGWDGSFRAGRDRYDLDVGVDLDPWRVSGGGSISPGQALGATARVDNRALGLQAWARTGLQGESRTDSVAASYTRDLTPGVALSVGTEVSGFAGRTGATGYQVALAVNQRLTWQNADYDVSQSYGGVPFAGIHAIGVSGGTRRLSPFGVRALTTYAVSPVSQRWSSSVSLFASPLRGLAMDITGATTVDGSGARGGVTWSVSPRVSYTIPWGQVSSASLVARYGHGGVASGTGTVWDRYEFGVRVGYLDLRVAAGAKYEVRREQGALDHEVSLEASVRTDYALSDDALLFASYAYDQNTSPVERVRHTLGFGWDHAWSPTIASRLGYGRTFDPIGTADRESLNVALGFDDVLLPGLRVNAGYTVRSPTSLLDFDARFTHDLRVGVGYDIPIVFDTPDPLVDLFGGRRGGELQGVAFLDTNLNGALDDGEPRLAGLEIRVGSERTTTDEDGRYRVRVPDGVYALAFASGLPATVDLRGDGEVRITENVVHERNLAFAPVVSMTVELFDDRDQDGIRSDGEVGIPFGGVVFEGAERRVVRTDGSGRATVSGLVTGTYVVSVSGDHLPGGYRATTDAATLTLRAGDRPDVLRLGAARPPRTMVQTFGAGSLAVMPRALQTSVARGAEVEVEALVQGDVERVVLLHAEGETGFEREGSRWRVRIQIPREIAAGPLTLSVRAEAGERSVERPVLVNVVDRPPFIAASIVAAVNEVVEVAVQTHFRAQAASLTMPDGETLTLISVDGYRWSATWQAPAEQGRFRAELHVDGDALGEVAVSVFAPPDRGDGACVPTPAGVQRATTEGGDDGSC